MKSHFSILFQKDIYFELFERQSQLFLLPYQLTVGCEIIV